MVQVAKDSEGVGRMLIIRHTKIFQGPSLWAPVPVILLEVAIG